MSNLKAHLSKLAVAGIILSSLGMAHATFAAATIDDYGGDYVTDGGLGLGDTDPIDFTIQIVNFTLGLLGLVATIIIIVGGFQWMTAGGNEEKVEKAKKLLIAALIGLVVILAAWGLSVFAINNLLDFTGAEGPSDSGS